MENKLAKLLIVVPLERHLTGFPHLDVVDRMGGNSKASSLWRFDRFLVIEG